jgi:hypothetical protein
VLLCGLQCRAESITDTSIFSCMENYLQENKMLDKGFRYKIKKDTNEVAMLTTCSADLDEYREMFYTELANELKADDDLAENSDCLIEQVKQQHLAEVAMKRHVYENTRKMSKRKRKKSLRAIDYALEKKMEVAVKLCTTDEVFGELFDALYASSNSTDSSEEKEESRQEDYCTRKYMVDNNFINTTVYSVTLNPENIDVSSLKCDDIMEATIKEAEDELKEEFEEEFERPSKRTMKCVVKAMRSNHFFENNVRVSILGEIKISDDAKIQERAKFIELMKDLYENILKC